MRQNLQETLFKFEKKWVETWMLLHVGKNTSLTLVADNEAYLRVSCEIYLPYVFFFR